MDGRVLVYDLSARTKAPVWTGTADASASIIGIGFPSGSVSVKKSVKPQEATSVATESKAFTQKSISTSPSAEANPAMSRVSKPSLADQSVNYMDMFSPVAKAPQPSIAAKMDRPPLMPALTQALNQTAINTNIVETKLAGIKEEGSVESSVKVDAAVNEEQVKRSNSNESTASKKETVAAKLPPFMPKLALSKREPVAATIEQDANMQLFSPVTTTAPSKASPVSSIPTTPTPAATDDKIAAKQASTVVESKESVSALKALVEPKVPVAAKSQVDSAPVERKSEVKKKDQALPVQNLQKPPMTKSNFTSTDKAVDRLRDNILQQASAAITASESTQQSQFSLSLLQSILDDSLDSFRTELRRDVQNMHLELLRQFEIQRGEMASLVHRVVSDAMRDAGRIGGLGEDDVGFWADAHRL